MGAQPAISQPQREQADVRADIQDPRLVVLTLDQFIDDRIVFAVNEDLVVDDPIRKGRNLDAQSRLERVLKATARTPAERTDRRTRTLQRARHSKRQVTLEAFTQACRTHPVRHRSSLGGNRLNHVPPFAIDRHRNDARNAFARVLLQRPLVEDDAFATDCSRETQGPAVSSIRMPAEAAARYRRPSFSARVGMTSLLANTGQVNPARPSVCVVPGHDVLRKRLTGCSANGRAKLDVGSAPEAVNF